MSTNEMDAGRAEQMARLLQQAHGGFALLAHAALPSSQHVTVSELRESLGLGETSCGSVLGFTALCMVFIYETVVAYFGAGPLEGALDDEVFQFIQEPEAAPGEDYHEALLRHLRNCFAHAQYSYHATSLTLMLEDYDGDDQLTFAATCDAADLAGMAEMLLLSAHAHLVSEYNLASGECADGANAGSSA